MSDKLKVRGAIAKVDESLGLVFGWAIVCTEDGQPYFDLQGDHIPEDVMMKAALDFMENSAVLKEMHDGEGKGYSVFTFPLTSEVAKAFGLGTQKTGLMIGVRPQDPEMLKRFQVGELTGFSIGGFCLREEVAEDD